MRRSMKMLASSSIEAISEGRSGFQTAAAPTQGLTPDVDIFHSLKKIRCFSGSSIMVMWIHHRL